MEKQMQEEVDNSLQENIQGTAKSGSEKSICEKIQDLALEEERLQVPEEERLTEWWGDYALYENKLGVSPEDIENRLQEYVQGRARSMDALCQENHLQNPNPNGGRMQGKTPSRKPTLNIGR